MLDLGWSEFLLIMMVALLVLGPKELSRAAFMIGNFLRQARNAFGDIKSAFENMAEELESRASHANTIEQRGQDETKQKVKTKEND